ncbi:MAG TPA: hypothetical protein VFA46_12580 [Actinomycetes bacterium]|nr:hypothetical protein [Actinomycetes bacterium]
MQGEDPCHAPRYGNDAEYLSGEAFGLRRSDFCCGHIDAADLVLQIAAGSAA